MPKYSKIVADYVVVGAGSAGAVIAARLSEDPDIRVVLLEAGGIDNSMLIRMPAGIGMLLTSGRHNWNYWTVPQKALGGRRITMPRGKVLGGSSSINGMVYIRGHALDYERWAAEGATGWSYAEVLPYFLRLEDHAQRGGSYHEKGGPVKVVTGAGENPLQQAFVAAGVEAGYSRTDDFNGYSQEGFGPYDMNVDGGRRASSAFAYLRPARRRANLSIITGAEVDRVTVKNGRATGVEARIGRRTVNIMAEREVIISAGATNSPKLLLLSGIGPADELRRLGINVVADHPEVGRNLQDHVEVHLQYRCPKPITLYQDMKPLSKLMIGAQWILRHDGKGATNHYEVGSFIHSDVGVRHPDLQMHFGPICYSDPTQRVVIEDGFRIHVGSMRSQSKGSVTLASANPEDPPLIDPCHMALEQDWIEARNAVRLTREVVAQKAFNGLRTDEISPGAGATSTKDIDDFIRQTCLTAYHPAGSCRMGNDATAVVDPQARVQGIEGLRVADASIMPSIISGNLNVPTMMIGEKVSDMIRGQALPSASSVSYHLRENWESRQR